MCLERFETTVKDIMTTDLLTLDVNDTLRLADDLLNLSHVRHFPVLQHGTLVGILDESDLLHASMRSIIHRARSAPRHALGTIFVKDVLRPATTIGSSASVREAAQLMLEQHVDCLVVLEREVVAGVITRTDLLREMARTRTHPRRQPSDQ
jgi:CBS domain-containing protein